MPASLFLLIVSTGCNCVDAAAFAIRLVVVVSLILAVCMCVCTHSTVFKQTGWQCGSAAVVNLSNSLHPRTFFFHFFFLHIIINHQIVGIRKKESRVVRKKKEGKRRIVFVTDSSSWICKAIACARVSLEQCFLMFFYCSLLSIYLSICLSLPPLFYSTLHQELIFLLVLFPPLPPFYWHNGTGNARAVAANENPLSNGKGEEDTHTHTHIPLRDIICLGRKRTRDWDSSGRIAFNVLGSSTRPYSPPFSRSTFYVPRPVPSRPASQKRRGISRSIQWSF